MAAPGTAHDTAQSGAAPVDAAAVRAFLATLHEHAAAALDGVIQPGVLNLLRFLPDTGFDACYRFPVGDIDGMTDQAIADSLTGFNVYVEGRTVRPGLSRKQRGAAADTIGVFALVIDSDADKGKPGFCRLQPSTIVETSPGNAHEWLFLDRALSHADASMLGEAIRHAGGDSATGKPDQPYRVAGTANYPDRRKRERGRTACPTRLLAASGAVYSATAIAAAYPASGRPNGAANGHATSQDDGLSSDELLAFLDPKLVDDITREPEPGEDRSGKAFSVILRLIMEGFSDTAIRTVLAAHPIGQRYREGKDLGADIRRARKKSQDDTQAPPGSGPQGKPTQPTVQIMTHANYRQRDSRQAGDFLIKGLARAGTLISVNGRPGAGKTALLMKLAECLDAGEPFLDRETRRCAVIYIAAEDEGDVVNRLEALELDDVLILVCEEGVPLTKPDRAAAIIREAIRLARERYPGREIFIPFDTLRAGLDGQSVLDDRFTAPALNKLRKLAEDEGVVICIANHTNRENPKMTKGETLESVVAMELILLEAEGDWFELHVGKNRSGPARRQIGRMKCTSIQVGDVDAAVVDVIETVAGGSDGEKPRKPGNNQSLLLAVMRNLTLDHGFSFRPYKDGPTVKAVKESLLRETFIERKAGDDRDNKRRGFVRALDQLLNRTLMRGENDKGEGVIWHARKDDESGHFAFVRPDLEES